MSSRSDEMLRDEGLNVISQSLYKEIYSELPNKIRDRRRWIWELMQNAKDVISSDGLVEITLSSTEVSFAHNGAPFTYNNLAAILSQRTSKAPDYTDDEKHLFFERLFTNEPAIPEDELKRFLRTSGRFGSGFMTTYLLSKKINLAGLYTDGERQKVFELSLDRSVELETDLIKKVKTSFDVFAEIEIFQEQDITAAISYDPALCSTKFTYVFEDESSETIAKEGIADLHASISFVFCFIELFKEVSVCEYGTKTVYKRIETTGPKGDLEIIRLSKQIGDEEPETLELVKVSAKHQAISVAMPIIKNESSYSLAFPEKNTPYQFISFPLIGSESFSFPVVIHSPLFNPGDAREKVFLNLTAETAYNKKVTMNRQILVKCLELYDQLVDYAVKNQWKNLHYLANTAIPTSTDLIWYKANIQDHVLSTIKRSPMVSPKFGEKPILVQDARFPVYKDDKLIEFWNLCCQLIGGKIPNENDVSLWKGIITENQDNWGDVQFDFGLEDLLALVAECANFTIFSEKYFKSDAEAAYKVLNDFINFVEVENKDLLDRAEKPYLLLPSQTGDFTEKRKLSRDKGWPLHLIPTAIKKVLQSMGNNWFEKLVKDEITCFESEKKRSVKDASDRVKAKTEKYLLKSVFTETEKEELKVFELYQNAMLELIGICHEETIMHKTIFGFSQKLFPELVSKELVIISGADEFDWSPCYRWIMAKCLEKVTSFKNMEGLTQYLYQLPYPNGVELSADESDLKYQTDVFINDLIGFAFNFNQNADHLLENYAVIPNQNNEFLVYGVDFFNDTYQKATQIGAVNDTRPIPERLKEILFVLGEDAKAYLLHEGITLKLPDARDTEYICGVADKLVIENRDSSVPAIKDSIRELDKWIAVNIHEVNRALYFGRFYEKRHSIVLNTYTPEERNHVDEILKSGKSEALANIAKQVNSTETMDKLVELVNNKDIERVMNVMEKYPDMTVQRMEHLLRLEELSRGLNTEINYTPDEIQQAKNFITGYKGEAFVYRELQKQGIKVEWPNQSLTIQNLTITDFENQSHYILDKGLPYDLKAELVNGQVIYIQVKATTTDIRSADAIALPISTSEWNYVSKTSVDESFYLARVFNVDEAPKSYYLKLEDSL
jgi:hypothetical protein